MDSEMPVAGRRLQSSFDSGRESWVASTTLTPTANQEPVSIIIGQRCTCFDEQKFLDLYRDEHSLHFGWYEREGSSKSRLPPLNSESLSNLEKLLGGIKQHFVPVAGCRLDQIAYMLATVRVEAYDFMRGVFFGPTIERISYASAEVHYGVGPTARRPTYARRHGNIDVGDGFKFRGRGFIQITWRSNYESFSSIAGVDLVASPDAAMEWEAALKIMVIGMVEGRFTGRKLDDYLGDGQSDFYGARRIINGLDKAHIIAEYAEKFLELLHSTRCPASE